MLWHVISHSKEILVHFSALGHVQMLSQIHELSRQQALILELPTSHNLLLRSGLLTVALDAGDVTVNLQRSWALECISLQIYRAAS